MEDRKADGAHVDGTCHLRKVGSSAPYLRGHAAKSKAVPGAWSPLSTITAHIHIQPIPYSLSSRITVTEMQSLEDTK